MCNSCVEICDAGVIKVVPDPTKILFKFETDGALPAKTVLLRGLKTLEERFEGLREQISTLEE